MIASATTTATATTRARTFREALIAGPLLFDGATGTQIYERGVLFNRSFDELNISQPDLIREIHADYVAAGAQVIETNTYGANRLALLRHDLQDRVVELNRAGVALAREAAGDRAFVAGAVAPTGLDPRGAMPEDVAQISDAFREQIAALRDAGVDVLILETFDLLEEIRLALAAARAEGADLPVIAQMRFGETGHAVDGTDPGRAALLLSEWGADAVGANCGGGPHEVFDAATAMVRAGVKRPVAAQANAGHPEQIEGRLIYVASPDFFATFSRRLLKAGVRIVGGCCGTGPAHIRAMAGAVRMMGHDALPSQQAVVITGDAVVQPSPGSRADAMRAMVADRPVTPMAERSRLGAALGQKFVVSVEVNPPFGLDPSPGVAAAQMVIDAGATVINSSDGPRASVRMDNVAFGSLVQREVGCEVILHVCCRDRNLLGTVSHLLGAHALGIRNLVVITGDPPKMGDYPDATAVYDLDSIGLLEIIAAMNRGIDPAGKEMPSPTNFVCATGAEPAALDYERELD
ncbi:MAG TPA: bifunctional homocysteine S-methyltransferase/methylenetetrahydrofolate reductase, partial [Thermomicrobiales bacterium]|nr:bifunctional homocysteine S-methyltransferase/methylenetetrahydrofolate reductase [Thermomicrobiales bacterium]